MSEAIQPDYVEPNMQHIRNRYLQHYFEEVGDFKQAYYYQMENQRIDDSHVMSVLKCVQLKLI